MRTFSVAIKWLFILCLPFLLLTASISLALNSFSLYKYGFEKYDVGQTTGLADVELDRAAIGLINYFNSSEEYISLSVVKDGQPFVLFNEREVIHLMDVKGLIKLNNLILLVTLVYVLGYTATTLWQKDHNQLAWGLVGGGSLTLTLMILLGLGMLLNFDQLFRQFHLLSFTNELWLLNPATDYLIMLFPGGFWYDAMIFCVLVTTAGAVILGGTGAIYLRLHRNKPA